jgi:hypothetical protein
VALESIGKIEGTRRDVVILKGPKVGIGLCGRLDVENTLRYQITVTPLQRSTPQVRDPPSCRLVGEEARASLAHATGTGRITTGGSIDDSNRTAIEVTKPASDYLRRNGDLPLDVDYLVGVDLLPVVGTPVVRPHPVG